MHLFNKPPLHPMHSFLHIRVSITGRFTIHLRDCHETYTREGLYCSSENQPLNTQIRRAGRELFEATPAVGCFTEIYEHDYIYLSCEDRRTGSTHGDPRGVQCNQFRVLAKQISSANMDHHTPDHPLLLGHVSIPIQTHDL